MVLIHSCWRTFHSSQNSVFALVYKCLRKQRVQYSMFAKGATLKGMSLDELKEHIPHKSKNNFTVVVEGNIGSGKTTLLQHFEHLSHCEVLSEPLDKWTNLRGHNPLGLLYQDPRRWSFSFNMYALLTRLKMHTKPHLSDRPVKMLERSLYSTHYCFVQNDYVNKTINEVEFAVFSEWFEQLVQTGNANVDLIVYLRASPENCFERLKKRCRKEEEGVPYALIESLHRLYDDWLLNRLSPVPAPVLLLDANYDLDTMKETYNSRRQEILCGFG
ncbi:unnamed protein product [Lymnaea stagnalis]|uniref:Deoxynucleoside kinase domain-containing protein n=1 Tax=Lymnaea stagnalis TaxID=6523 RepID=A0AAV2H891_LYMST